MRTTTSIIIIIIMFTLSPISYAKKIIQDYSSTATGFSGECYKESLSIDVAQTSAENNLRRECEDYGWRSVKDVTFGATADCIECDTGSKTYVCKVVAKGWCFKYD